jgi:hypothetical protein
VHALRLVRERFPHVRATSQPHSDFPCLPETAKAQRFALTRICQAVAASACEQLTSAVQYCDATATVSTTGIDGTDEPRTTATEVAFRPGDWYALLDRFPLGIFVASHAIRQKNGVRPGTHGDTAGRLSAEAPGAREALTRGQPSVAMPSRALSCDVAPAIQQLLPGLRTLRGRRASAACIGMRRCDVVIYGSRACLTKARMIQ